MRNTRVFTVFVEGDDAAVHVKGASDDIALTKSVLGTRDVAVVQCPAGAFTAPTLGSVAEEQRG